MKNFLYKKELVIFLATLVLFGFAYFKSDRVEKRVENLVVSNGDEELLGGSTLFAQNASVQLNLEVFGTYASTSGNLSFNGEIMPDGVTCSNGQILKKTAANDWDCASDAGGVASNSLDWDEIVDSMTLDANLTIASTSNNYTIDFLDTRVDIADTTFLSNGNVGIGTTGPATLLHIKGTTPTLRIEGARKYDLRLDADVSGQFDIADMTTGAARLVINPNGNVGIGTTGPGAKLEVAGDMQATSLGIGGPMATAGTIQIYSTANKFRLTYPTIADVDFVVNSAGQLSVSGGTSVYLNSGNVGIGTTVPNRTLSVSGTASISSDLFLESTLQGGNVTGAATAYNRFGTDTTSHAGSIAASNDLLISGDFEVNGSTAFDGFTQLTNASVSDNFEVENSLIIGNAGVSVTDDGDGAITFQGLGNGTDENLTMNLDDTSNRVVFTTTTSVAGLTFTNMGLTSGAAGTYNLIGSSPDLNNAAYGFSNDANTGMWNPSANVIGFITNGSNTASISQGLLRLSGAASVSTNFEVVGYASASKYFGAGVNGAGDCNDATDKLLYDSGTGLFTCGTLADADIPDTITLSGGTIGSNNISAASTWTTLGTLTIGDNGDAVNFDTSTWDVSAGIFSGVLGMTGTGVYDFGGATSFEIPNGAGGTTVDATGEVTIDSSSSSFNFFDGTAERILSSEQCFTYYIESPTSSNPLSVGHKRFFDPFTITKVSSTASGSNAAGWNLQYGVPGTVTTNVFTTAKSASTSSSPIYTSFANSAVSDGNVLDVRITSASAVLQSFTVNVCGRYNH